MGLELQRTTNDLDEGAVGRHVTEGAAAALQCGGPCRRQTFAKLVHEPALPDARVANDLDYTPVAAVSRVDITFEPREMRLAADIQREPGSLRGLETRLQTGLPDHPGWRDGRTVGLDDYRRARNCKNEWRQESLAFGAQHDVARRRRRREPRCDGAPTTCQELPPSHIYPRQILPVDRLVPTMPSSSVRRRFAH